ncbi:hypothetical protein F0185_26580 [Massilia sp. CCM 8692]|uniref:Type II toxin-antitoxin system RelE/ParE family toxin n=2 Tax=Massilia rubra TaxID=2607910 RepID=A0ABX0LQJ6_9BURK|nr:hypothetical protein [Massilia rubra]
MAKKPLSASESRPGPARAVRKNVRAPSAEIPRAEPVVKKEVRWMGDAKDVMSGFPAEAKQAGGEELYRIQCGEDAVDAAPMGEVGSGAYEIRINKAGGWFRVFYVAKFGDAIYVLHAFQKKTNKTPKEDIDIGKRRYALAQADAKAAAAKAPKTVAPKTTP